MPAVTAVRFAAMPEVLMHSMLASFLLYQAVYALVISASWAQQRRIARSAPRAFAIGQTDSSLIQPGNELPAVRLNAP
ncbi:hypothetical protein [Massilia sp. MS-15]|uniref:hypothetical protein n=1 Tax=Massilia sp. MS-15 TaxID=2878200 RepID=UPI001CD60969|nr:hypothetical protein [Massilia sp. MS-15]MCA1248492.1 hypothetical protein [Massilia sp. MS-15]